MKQKMVVKVTMNCQKCRSKALHIAAGLVGVESASLKGDDKSQIEVTGVGIDPVKLTILLRKSMGHAELVSVSTVDGKKPAVEKPAAKVCSQSNPMYYVHEIPLYGREPSCSFL